MATRLILVRHAHTTSNNGSTACLTGWTDVPLSARGREEIYWLRRGLSDGTPFDAIYSSPLRRARTTADALAGVCACPIRVRPLLQEIDCGILDGLPLHQVRCRFPDLWAANFRQSDEHFRWPGGESYREFRARCLKTIRVLTHTHPTGRIAVVTHAGLISQVLGFLAGASPARWGIAPPGTTAVSEVEWHRRGAGKVLRFDDRAHLPLALR